jgi:pyrimidine oxygenase
MPSFDLNREIVTKAEACGFRFRADDDQAARLWRQDAVLGAQSGELHADGGLAAVTSKIKLYATAATLTLPPAIVARMAVTIDPSAMAVSV